MDEISQGGGGGSSTLAGLNDVNISSPTDGQALVYDNATQKWVNRAGGGGSSTFAGLNDVDVAGVANKDIARFNSSTNKWEKSSDLTDLELSVSQLSSSVLSIAGDVGTLELTVSQMSASTLPYDANTSTKQKIDNVESNIPTSASDLPYSSTQSTKQKIDEVNQSLLKCATVQFDLPSAINAGQNAQVVLLSGYNIKTSNKTDILSGKKLSEIFGNATEFLGLIFTWANGSVDVMSSCLIDKSTGVASVVTMHLGAASTLTAIRLVVFYK
jgi:hypothetical protein